jgi:hypothetical protein
MGRDKRQLKDMLLCVLEVLAGDKEEEGKREPKLKR